jgi:hypothetical protein
MTQTSMSVGELAGGWAKVMGGIIGEVNRARGRLGSRSGVIVWRQCEDESRQWELWVMHSCHSRRFFVALCPSFQAQIQISRSPHAIGGLMPPEPNHIGAISSSPVAVSAAATALRVSPWRAMKRNTALLKLTPGSPSEDAGAYKSSTQKPVQAISRADRRGRWALGRKGTGLTASRQPARQSE